MYTKENEMITYKMTITNPERCDKTVWVTGENYYEAVAKVIAEYGSAWRVRSSEIVFMQ